jgi:Arc/MetJ-type ribon-helix-helix transcriptional regulator
MKLSISLTDADVALIDELAAEGAFTSRSAVIQHALARLRAQGLQADYGQAWDEWAAEGDAEPWDATVGDGVATPARAVQGAKK